MVGRLYKVRYIDESSDDELYNLVSEILKPIEIVGIDVLEQLDKQIEIVGSLLSVVNSLKHASWSYENEIRLTFASGDTAPPGDIPVSVLPDDSYYEWVPSKVRCSGDQEIQYHSFPFGKFREGSHDPSRSIQEVVIGPKSALLESDVKRTLDESGFSGFSVKRSQCLFR